MSGGAGGADIVRKSGVPLGRWKERPSAIEQIIAPSGPAAAASTAPTRPILPAALRAVWPSVAVGIVVEAVGETVSVGIRVVPVEAEGRLLTVGQAVEVRILVS